MIRESDIASAASEWLASEGWSVYHEVSLDWQLRQRHALGDARADLVATRGEQVAVVEAKVALSFDLFAQAKRWNPYADLVWVAIPHGKRTDGRLEAFAIAREYYGVGVLEIGCEPPTPWEKELGDSGHGNVRERVKPRAHRRAEDALLVSLEPEHQTHAAAGTNRGGQWTAFKRTATAIAKYVTEHPGCKIAEVVGAVEHHYRSKASAVASLEKAIKRGQIPGVDRGWRQGLYPIAVATEKEATA